MTLTILTQNNEPLHILLNRINPPSKRAFTTQELHTLTDLCLARTQDIALSWPPLLPPQVRWKPYVKIFAQCHGWIPEVKRFYAARALLEREGGLWLCDGKEAGMEVGIEMGIGIGTRWSDRDIEKAFMAFGEEEAEWDEEMEWLKEVIEESF